MGNAQATEEEGIHKAPKQTQAESAKGDSDLECLRWNLEVRFSVLTDDSGKEDRRKAI